MAGIDLIQDFAILLLAAGVAGLLCRRLGLSVIVGYLLAGIVIGPHTPPFSFIVDQDRIQALSQVGLVFLMFSIGLGLSITKFGRMGAPTLIATALGAFFVLNLTELLGFAVGWTPLQSMFIAAMLMVSSSAVIAKIVGELKRSHEHSSQMALAVTVLEDVVAVTMLTILAGQTMADADSGGMGRLIGTMGAFVVLLVSAGLLFIPRLLRRLEAKADPEMQTIIVAGVLFLLAMTAFKAGYSIALGAFLFGAMVAEIPQKIGIEKSFMGLRDVFSSVFFVSIGMMIDLSLLVEVWPTILALSAFALIVRPVACGLALILVGTEPSDARRAGLLLTPLGEFSFIIAQLGVTSAVLPASYYPVAVGASILTVFSTPLVNRHREAILRMTDKLEPRWLQKTIDAYHGWVLQLRSRPSRTPIWKLLRGRFTQLAVEVLFITGLLIYSERLLEALEASPLTSGLEPAVLATTFWVLVGVIVLIPLVAIWRNCVTVSMILAESLGGTPLPPGLLERLFKALMALGIAYWLYLIVPQGGLSRWGWLLIVVAAIAVVGIFSSRLIYWHSQWQVSVREVLDDTRSEVGEAREHARASLGQRLGAWNLILADCIVPDNASYAGKTLAELAIPSRFGCTVVELDRNGHSIPQLGPNLAVFPGDRILFLGEAQAVEQTSNFLSQQSLQSVGLDGFESVVLDLYKMTGPKSGHTLAELEVPRNTGVRIIGVQRGEQRIINPSADLKLTEGDSLLLLGTLAQIRRFRQWLQTA